MNGTRDRTNSATAGATDRRAASLHEAAHAVCAHALGMRVTGVAIRPGPLSIVGETHYLTGPGHSARQMAAVTLAGVVANYRTGGWSREDSTERSLVDAGAAVRLVAASKSPRAELQAAFRLAGELVREFWSAIVLVAQWIRAFGSLSGPLFRTAMVLWESVHTVGGYDDG